MNPIVLLICGLPGSGKSTVASRLRDSLISESDGIHNISPVLQYKVGLDASIVCFDDVHRHEVLKDTRSASLALLDSSLSEGACGDEGALSGKITARVIIVDDVMEYGSMRREVYTRARDAKAHYIVVWVRCDLAVALQRDASRVGAAHIGESVIRKIASRFEPMDPKDIWDRNFLEVDSNDPIR
jgi:tRNA uridine 5-carbamoylmethylation protein Kti12